MTFTNVPSAESEVKLREPTRTFSPGFRPDLRRHGYLQLSPAREMAVRLPAPVTSLYADFSVSRPRRIGWSFRSYAGHYSDTVPDSSSALPARKRLLLRPEVPYVLMRSLLRRSLSLTVSVFSSPSRAVDGQIMQVSLHNRTGRSERLEAQACFVHRGDRGHDSEMEFSRFIAAFFPKNCLLHCRHYTTSGQKDPGKKVANVKAPGNSPGNTYEHPRLRGTLQ